MDTWKSVWRAVVIGSLLGSIPLYVLQCTLIPKSGTFGLTLDNSFADAPNVTERVLDVTSDSPAWRAGIRAGDTIPIRTSNGAMLVNPLPGDRLILTYVHGGTEHTSAMTSQARPPYVWTLPDAIRAAVSLCLLAFALLVIARAWNTKHGPIIATILAGIVVNAAADRIPFTARSGIDAALLVITYGLSQFAFAFGAAMLMLLLWQIVEEPIRLLRGLTYSSFVLSAIAGICAPIILALSFAGQAGPISEFVANWLYLECMIIVALAGLIVAFCSARGESRQRARWLLWGFGPFLAAVALVNGVTLIPASASFLLAHPQLALTYNMVNRVLELSLPAALFFGVLVRRVIDLGFVMNRVAVYSALSIVLLAIFVLLEFGISKLFLDTSRTGSLMIQLGIALAIGVSARYLHQVVDRLVDRVLFAKRHANESALRRFAHETEAYTSAAALLDRTVEILNDHSETRGAAIYLTSDGRAQLARTSRSDFPTSVDLDDPLLVKLRRWNEPVDTAEVKTAFPEGMVFPMNARGKFIGALACQEKRDHSAFDPDERASLLEVARDVGIALDAISSDADASVGALQEAMASMQSAILALPRTIVRELRAEREPELQ
jgi:hypothetical protein